MGIAEASRGFVSRWYWWAIGGVAVLLAVVVAVLVDRHFEEERLADEARIACKPWVLEELGLEPSVRAEFSDGPTKGQLHSWTVTGTVVAQDGLGVPVRAAWTCTASLMDTDWVGAVDLH